MAHRKPHKPAAQQPKPDRRPAVVMSVLGAVGFGWAGVSTLMDHRITWPARSGAPLQMTGSDAELFAWVLLAAATACVSFFAQALQPGATGLKWTAASFGVWAAAAVTYYLMRAA
jgi:hypothetical protein